MTQAGTSMCGGEQQMLAIARAMMAKPPMALVDEPSEGAMPALADRKIQQRCCTVQPGAANAPLPPRRVEAAQRAGPRRG